MEDRVRPTRLNIADFDHHDQALLWAALQAGQCFAVVVDGPCGLKVAYVSEKDPTWSLCLSAATERLIRIKQVDGLGEFAPGPDLEIGSDDLGHVARPNERSPGSRQ